MGQRYMESKTFSELILDAQNITDEYLLLVFFFINIILDVIWLDDHQYFADILTNIDLNYIIDKETLMLNLKKIIS